MNKAKKYAATTEPVPEFSGGVTRSRLASIDEHGQCIVGGSRLTDKEALGLARWIKEWIEEPGAKKAEIHRYYVALDPDTDNPLPRSTGYAVYRDSDLIADGFATVHGAAMFAGLANIYGADGALEHLSAPVKEFINYYPPT